MRRNTLILTLALLLSLGVLAAWAAETPQATPDTPAAEVVEAPAAITPVKACPDQPELAPEPAELAELPCETALDCAAWCQELMPGCFPRCLVGWCDCLCSPDPDL